MPQTPALACLATAVDMSGLSLRPRMLDWGGAQNLVQVDSGATLAFRDIVSAHPGSFTEGEQVGRRCMRRQRGAGMAAAASPRAGLHSRACMQLPVHPAILPALRAFADNAAEEQRQLCLADRGPARRQHGGLPVNVAVAAAMRLRLL